MDSWKRRWVELSWRAAAGIIVSICFLTAAGMCAISQFREGALFSRAAIQGHAIDLTSQPAASMGEPVAANWFPIPDWLAGTWHSDSELVLDAYDYREASTPSDLPAKLDVKRDSVIGMQQDRKGRIWYCASTPFERIVEGGSFADRQRMEKIVLLENSPSEVRVDCLATVTRMDACSGEILNQFYEETVTNYQPMADDRIQVTFLVTDYDEQGLPLYRSKAICTETRVKPFVAVDQDQRGDLQLQFRNCLIASGLSQLTYKD